MKLFTDQQYQQLLENGSTENCDKNHIPVVHLTLPGTDCEWLLSEINPDEPNIAFGLCDLGLGFPELGYVDLNELRTIEVPPFGSTVYTNPFFEGKYPMSVYASAARICDHITRKDDLLKKLYAMELVKEQYKPQP